MKPPADLKQWSKNNLVREVQRLRAVVHEHSELVGDDPRTASASDPIIGGSPQGRGDALIDTRAAVLLEGVNVVLVDRKTPKAAMSMVLSLSGRINYADDRVTHAYLLNGDGAAGIVVELVGLAQRASSMEDPNGMEFAADFKVAMEERMKELP
jgi:hypothetical protein